MIYRRIKPSFYPQLPLSTLKNIVLISIFWHSHFLFFAGLEPHLVHSQPRLDTVFPEHCAGMGPLYLSLAVGPFLLPSPLLPRPWTHSNVCTLHCQDGETSCGRHVTDFHTDTLEKRLLVFPNKIPDISPIRRLVLSCSGAGLPARLLRLCGVLLHPAGEEPGDPAAHGLPTQPHHTQYDCGKYRGSTLIFRSCLPQLTLFFRCKCLEPSS